MFENVWCVNTSPRLGHTNRVNGPTLRWGNVGDFKLDVTRDAMIVPGGGVWQHTGNNNDT